MNLAPYLGYFRALKNRIRDSVTEWWNAVKHTPSSGPEGTNFQTMVQQKLDRIKVETVQRIDALSGSGPNDFSHIYRRKTRMEMIKISAAVCGIEFAYAAETAFVSPLLLNLGLRHRHLTLMWFLSPLLGFFITPILGSLSDGCRSKLGRRRPFIILLSIGIILGLILVPNGKQIGIWFGDTYKTQTTRLSANQSEAAGNNSNNNLSRIVPREANREWEVTILTKNLSAPPVSPEWEKAILKKNLSSIHVNTTRVDDLLPNLDESVHFQQLRYAAMLARNSSINAHSNNSSKTLNATVGITLGQNDMQSNRYRYLSGPRGLDTHLVPPRRDPLLEKEANESETRYFNNYRSRHHGTRRPNELRIKTLFHDILSEWETEFMAKTPGHANVDHRHEEELEESESPHTTTVSTNGSSAPASTGENGTDEEDELDEGAWSHSWGLFFTVMGTVLLDFDADACQSPSRAFMLDVTVPEDQARGLSTFTIISGLGGGLGYLLGAVDWEHTFIGNFFGGQVRAVFTLILFIFIGCVYVTVTSFCELPVDALHSVKLIGSNNMTDGQRLRRIDNTRTSRRYSRFHNEEDSDDADTSAPDTSSTTTPQAGQQEETSFTQQESSVRFENHDHDHDHERSASAIYSPTTDRRSISVSVAAAAADTTPLPTFRDYVKTIVRLPTSLRWLCLTNFFSWLSLVCYSLYFTDFVGEAVFRGNPNAAVGSKARTLYQNGVRFGCLGMALYSLSCSVYSMVIEKCVYKFGAKKVYICGHLVYSSGMVLMALTCTRIAVIVFSWTSGILYATLFTMPYLLVARYHASEIFDASAVNSSSTQSQSQRRGLGTDVAIVSSMVFLAQMTQSLILGTIVTMAGSTVAIICAAAVFSICGALAATKVLYLDL